MMDVLELFVICAMVLVAFIVGYQTGKDDANERK
jgi:Mn2+/Fe2+ NRAMP family transporter